MPLEILLKKNSVRLVEPFSNQAELLETLFTSHVLCYLLFPILGGYAEGKILSFMFKSDIAPLNFTFHIFSWNHSLVFVYGGVCYQRFNCM